MALTFSLGGNLVVVIAVVNYKLWLDASIMLLWTISIIFWLKCIFFLLACVFGSNLTFFSACLIESWGYSLPFCPFSMEIYVWHNQILTEMLQKWSRFELCYGTTHFWSFKSYNFLFYLEDAFIGCCVSLLHSCSCCVVPGHSLTSFCRVVCVVCFGQCSTWF